MRSARSGSSVAGVRTPTQISAPGSCRRHSSLQTKLITRLATMSRPRDDGIVIGTLDPGERNSIADAGVTVGHVTVEVTGVTAIVPPLLPALAGTAVLNGAGELTGAHEIREWGLRAPASRCRDVRRCRRPRPARRPMRAAPTPRPPSC